MKTTNTTASTVEATETKQAHAIEFIISKGLLSEYVNYVTSKGNTYQKDSEVLEVLEAFETLVDLYKTTLQKFEIEKNAKNKAYSFIISGGYLPEFREFNSNIQS